ncbi:popeye domain-containing protein 3-like [Tropilaelaps mercedesae]|uniref:Popeye domain-containing protein 3-like n=1 Tax=Tropilaelaps mercedesae TaxID=418985 RepID=A0A1V9XL71_9ACAR|nr:popeye domain-containing protein 3-like [Tropilaelaps mercedesae]
MDLMLNASVALLDISSEQDSVPEATVASLQMPTSLLGKSDHLVICRSWKEPQHVLFQVANAFFVLAFVAPDNKYGVLFLHTLLMVAFLFTTAWAWNVLCAPDLFFYSFAAMIINMAQTIYLLFTHRQVKFPGELEDIYEVLFAPMRVSRMLFKRLVSLEYAQARNYLHYDVLNLHAGEAYAMQNLTRTDRLALLIAGKASVLSDHHFLHHINPREFLDSPEFESTRSGKEDKYKVTIIAVTPCRYILWQRQNLEYLLVKETFLAAVFALLLERDITSKLYAMNEKIVTEKGEQLDIRLPSVTGSMTYQLAAEATSQLHYRSRSHTPHSHHTGGSPMDKEKDQRSQSIK